MATHGLVGKLCVYIYIYMAKFKGLVAALYVYSYKMIIIIFLLLEHGFGGTCCVLLSSMAEYYVIHI